MVELLSHTDIFMTLFNGMAMGEKNVTAYLKVVQIVSIFWYRTERTCTE